MSEKLVLAYSGGLDSSVLIRWLKENYEYGVATTQGNPERCYVESDACAAQGQVESYRD